MKLLFIPFINHYQSLNGKRRTEENPHVVDHPHEPVVEHFMRLVKMRLHPFGHRAKGLAGGGAGGAAGVVVGK